MNYGSKLGRENASMIEPRFCLACWHACSGSCSGDGCKGGCSSSCDNGCSGQCGNNCTGAGYSEGQT